MTKQKSKVKRPPRKPAVKQSRPLPDCVERYVHARVNAFSPKAVGACLPLGDGGKTLKYTTRLNADFTHSTGQGYGICVNPTASNTTPSLYSRIIGSTTPIDDATAWYTHVAYGSPFPESAFGAGSLEQRLVGWSIRVRQVGPPLYKQGSMLGYTTPSGLPLAGATTSNQLFGYENARIMPVDGSTLVLSGDLDQEYESAMWFHTAYYRNLSTIIGTSPNNVRGPIAYIWVPPDASSSISINVEYIAHWEVRGRTVTPIGTLNEVEPALYERAFAYASQTLRSLGNTAPSPDRLAQVVLHALRVGALHYAPRGGRRLRLEL